MGRNSDRGRGKISKQHSKHRGPKQSRFKSKRKQSNNVSEKQDLKSKTKTVFKGIIDNSLVIRPKEKYQSVNQVKNNEDLVSSDSEQDAFSQLVSCFSVKTGKESIISDDDSSECDSADEDRTSQDELRDSMEMEKDMSAEDVEDSLNSDLDDDPGDTPGNDDLTLLDINNSAPCDPFENHVQWDLEDNLFNAVSSVPQTVEEVNITWPILGQLRFVMPRPMNNSGESKNKIRIDGDLIYAKPGEVPHRIEHVSDTDWCKLSVKQQIQGNILTANAKHAGILPEKSNHLTSLQKELFSIVNNYQDLYYPKRNLDNGEEVRFVYCLHAINHVLKTRLKIVHHNARLANKEDHKGDIPDEFRDQGLIRPKVLILVPFRNAAVRVVEMMCSILLEEGNNNILNKKRFMDEFTSGEIVMPRKNPKPEDYEKTFAGDTDDNFKIGISVTKKSIKLYVDFYSADIIIASPLGLRMIVGAEGQAERDYDFLASIELLVLDQAEIILMQNWDHLLQVWDHLHLQPKESHGTNFARVRPWALSGRARYYRQTLLFSAYSLPQFSALFSRRCLNYAGKVYVINPVSMGSICQIVLQLPQVFNRIDCNSATESIDARFNYFISKVLPEYKEPMMSHTVIYVPSYFDYVRLRNYFKKETVSFVQICEYSKDGKVARARDMFFHSSAHFLLYSERFHFFRRIRLRGIRHIVFYQPPTIPHFYSEVCNLMQSAKQTEETALSVTVLYTRYDSAQLAAIVGSDRAGRMLASDRAVHMFMTGE